MLTSGMMSAHAANDRIIRIDRPGKAPLLYLATGAEGQAPQVGVILFVGSEGVIDLANKGIPQPGHNFLLRARAVFAERGLAVASFDPSADSAPLSDGVRMSNLHAEEVRQVLSDFKDRFGLKQVYLVGTSRGTISAAHLAVYFGKEISGVVLTSTVFVSSRTGPGLASFDFDQIPVPLLFVHHGHDACRVTPPDGARRMSDRFPVVFIEGGDWQRGDTCGPFGPHGFLGRERETVEVISDWILWRKLGNGSAPDAPKVE